MAYKTVVSKNTQGTAAYLSDLWAFMSDTGWVLHDNQDVSNYRVYKSVNDGSQAPVYIRIAFDGASEYDGGGDTDANKIYFSVYYYWDATGHAGVGKLINIYPYIYTTSASGWFYWMYGDEFGMYLISKVAGVYYQVAVLSVPSPIWGTSTKLSSAATAGSDVTLALDDGTGFVKDRWYQLIGVDGEGRQLVKVTDVTGNNMTVETVDVNYNAGAFIGECPSTFCMSDPTTVFSGYIRMINGWPSSGTSDYNGSVIDYADIWGNQGDTQYQADNITNRWWMAPTYMYENGLIGEMNDFVCFFGDTNEFTSESVLYPDELDSGTSSGSNTASTFNDTAKSWTTDEYAGKIIIIYGGTGYSQVRKIQSNTGSQLTLVTDWAETPDNASLYRIVDYAYRFFSSGRGVALREGSDV